MDYKIICDEIRSRLDFADFVASYGVKLHRRGGDYVGLCPFHNEDTPSFHVYVGEGSYHCYGCKAHGDAITFAMTKEGLSFNEAIEKLANRCGVELEHHSAAKTNESLNRLYALHAEIAEFFHRCLKTLKVAEAARNYLTKRQIGCDSIDSFKLGYAPSEVSTILKWGTKYGFTESDLNTAGIILPPADGHSRWFNRFSNRLLFPIADKLGRVVGFSGRRLDENTRCPKYVNSPETPIFKKGRILYGLDKAASEIIRSKGRKAVICEGQIDVIRCHSCGFKTVVASEGTSFTNDHIRMLKQVADEVVIAFDGDEAGYNATIRVGRDFISEGMFVSVAAFPEGEDPDSYLRKYGSEAFASCLVNANSLTCHLVKTQLGEDSSEKKSADINRVAQSVSKILDTCPSAILRDVLAVEAAKLLGIGKSAFDPTMARQKVTDRGVAIQGITRPNANRRIVTNLGEKLCAILACCATDENTRAKCLKALDDSHWQTIVKDNFVVDYISSWIDNPSSHTNVCLRNFSPVKNIAGVVNTKAWIRNANCIDHEVSLIIVLEDLLRRLWKVALVECRRNVSDRGSQARIGEFIRVLSRAPWNVFIASIADMKKAIGNG